MRAVLLKQKDVYNRSIHKQASDNKYIKGILLARIAFATYNMPCNACHVIASCRACRPSLYSMGPKIVGRETFHSGSRNNLTLL